MARLRGVDGVVPAVLAEGKRRGPGGGAGRRIDMEVCYKENRGIANPAPETVVRKEPTTIKETIIEIGYALREIECRTTSISCFFELKEDPVRPTSEPKDMGEALQQNLETAKKALCNIAEIEARLGM